MLELCPVELREANAYVELTHRHHPRARGHRFSVGVRDERGIHGVAIASRPRSRHLQAAGYLEVIRVSTDGTPNACSMLYGAMRRAGMALGYRPDRIITYTLVSEPGASLRASGWVLDGEAGGGSWDRIDRPRTDNAPLERKLRWLAGPRA